MGKGHPILGAVAGLIFGLSVALDLTFFKVTVLSSVVLFGCAGAGLVLGLLLGIGGPFGRRRARQP